MMAISFLSLPLGPVLVSLFSTLDEFLQIFSTTRSFDLFDLAENWLGIWIFYGVAETIRRMRLNPAQPKSKSMKN